MWLLIKYILLRLSMNMCISIWVICMVLIAMSIVFNYALRMSWYLGNLSNIWVFCFWVVYSITCCIAFYLALGGGRVNDLFVYMHFCGGYLRRCWW